MASKPKRPPVKSRQLTVSQRAEAIALWRAGTVTLADLSKKFGKRVETFSRMFKRLEITKGSAIPAMAKKMEAAITTRTVTETEETLQKIASVKAEHIQMSRAMSRMVWEQLKRAREEKIDIASLKDVMATLKLASEVIGNSRKELFAILNVEKHDAVQNFDDLPELVVRELTGSEITLIQNQPIDDMGLDSDPGADMLPDDIEEGS